ncbi:MAG TPA: OmpH family outer membrane protein [Planctomycetota bacterium]|nr:OmpH family outer membrane protein [Planctomycetota bacterium]
MRIHLPITLALAAIVLGAVSFAQDNKPKTPKSGILIVSLGRTIDECDEGKDIIAKLKEEMATKKQALTDEAAKLNEKVKVLREAKPADRTPQYYEELEKAMKESARLEMEKNIFGAKKQDEMNRRMQQLLQGAQDAARAVMKECGAEVVLVTRTGPIEFVTDQDLQQELVMRRVLCCDDSIDITDEVIKRMNQWYKENKNTAGLPERGEKKEPAKEDPKGAEMKGGAEKAGK